jgi:hypothetical protein
MQYGTKGVVGLMIMLLNQDCPHIDRDTRAMVGPLVTACTLLTCMHVLPCCGRYLNPESAMRQLLGDNPLQQQEYQPLLTLFGSDATNWSDYILW